MKQFYIGDMVVFVGSDKQHSLYSNNYPKPGTLGIVKIVFSDIDHRSYAVAWDGFYNYGVARGEDLESFEDLKDMGIFDDKPIGVKPIKSVEPSCPNCGTRISSDDRYFINGIKVARGARFNYCPMCGVEIDWSGYDEDLPK